MSYQRRSTYSSIPIKSKNRRSIGRNILTEKRIYLILCTLISVAVFTTLPFFAFAERCRDETDEYPEEAVAVFSFSGEEDHYYAKDQDIKEDVSDLFDIEAAAQKYIEEHTPKYVFPLDGYITSGFAERIDPVTLSDEEYHLGIDISAATDVEISAYADGVVEKTVVSDVGYGIYLILAHDGFETLYAHCSELLVSEGDTVRAGDVIAIAGSTGRSTGTHLHFEVRIDGVQIDPMIHMEENGVKAYA